MVSRRRPETAKISPFPASSARGTSRSDVTRKTWRRCAERTTIRAPARTLSSSAYGPSPCVLESMWAATRVEPNGSPSREPPRHHPAVRMSSGTSSTPSARRADGDHRHRPPAGQPHPRRRLGPLTDSGRRLHGRRRRRGRGRCRGGSPVSRATWSPRVRRHRPRFPSPHASATPATKRDREQRDDASSRASSDASSPDHDRDSVSDRTGARGRRPRAPPTRWRSSTGPGCRRPPGWLRARRGSSCRRPGCRWRRPW